MKIAVVTIFPEMLNALNFGIPMQAQKKKLLEIRAINPRDFTSDRHRSVDDRPYGGGPGMLMMAEPIKHAIDTAKAWLGQESRVIYLSPQGQLLKQQALKKWVQCEKCILLAGRYEGIDERLMRLVVDEEWSIGDYVLSGGELPAMVLIDAISRLLPGVLAHKESAAQDSFSDGLLDYPHYTRPEVFAGMKVPDVLLSGHHAEIAKWRKQQSIERTKTRRPDLLAQKEIL